MLLPKFVVIAVFLLIIAAYFLRRTQFGNRYLWIGIMVIITLGVIFSDSLYRAVSRKVMNYVQAPMSTNLPFIPEKWKNANSSNPNDNTRNRMSADLLMHHRLYGKNRKDILDLLGEPDKTNKFPNWEMKYSLGPSPESGNPDIDWLVIKFDEKGVVGEYHILTLHSR